MNYPPPAPLPSSVIRLSAIRAATSVTYVRTDAGASDSTSIASSSSSSSHVPVASSPPSRASPVSSSSPSSISPSPSSLSISSRPPLVHMRLHRDSDASSDSDIDNDDDSDDDAADSRRKRKGESDGMLTKQSSSSAIPPSSSQPSASPRPSATEAMISAVAARRLQQRMQNTTTSLRRDLRAQSIIRANDESGATGDGDARTGRGLLPASGVENVRHELGAPSYKPRPSHPPSHPTSSSSSSSSTHPHPSSHHPALHRSASSSAVLRDETNMDQLPPPLPLIQSSKKEFVSRLPKTGFGLDAVPCCRSPSHLLTSPLVPEPLLSSVSPEHRLLLIAKLKQYDAKRNDPNIPLSPLFINRIVYDCTAAPVFSKRWIAGTTGAAGSEGEKCTCMNCTLYTSSASGAESAGLPSAAAYGSEPSSASHHSHHHASSSHNHSPSLGPLSAPSASFPSSPSLAPTSASAPLLSCNGEWLVEVRSFYTPTAPTDTTLVFESRFESGNLRTGFQVSEQEYDLTIRPDFNTTQYGERRENRVYKFNMINFVKPASLYNEGMQPLIYSTIAAGSGAESGEPFAAPRPPSAPSSTPGATGTPQGWIRAGSNVCYYQNHIARASSRQRFYYTLSFTIEFQHDHDTVYFAYCYPYTYTNLNRDLHYLELNPSRALFVRRRLLVRTLAGNEVDMLTITNFACSAEEMRGRKGIVYTARVHPGESNASWMMRGCIDFLTGPSAHAVALRNAFIFKLVPMLNVDGVVNGNYRCSLAGVDLNRNWKNPSAAIHPTIHATKVMIKRMAAVRPILMCIDLHGHSRKFNVFIYGCPNVNVVQAQALINAGVASAAPAPGPATPVAPITIIATPPTIAPARGKKVSAVQAALLREQAKIEKKQAEVEKEAAMNPNRLLERVYSRLLSRESSFPSSSVLSAASLALLPGSSSGSASSHPALLTSAASLPPTGFRLSDCSFTISRGKESTARVVLWRELGLTNSFTMEASFAGANHGALRGCQYSIGNFENMGRSMVATLLDYTDSTLHEAARRSLCEAYPHDSAGRNDDDSDDSSDSPNETPQPITNGRYLAKIRKKTRAASNDTRKTNFAAPDAAALANAQSMVDRAEKIATNHKHSTSAGKSASHGPSSTSSSVSNDAPPQPTQLDSARGRGVISRLQLSSLASSSSNVAPLVVASASSVASSSASLANPSSTRQPSTSRVDRERLQALWAQAQTDESEPDAIRRLAHVAHAQRKKSNNAATQAQAQVRKRTDESAAGNDEDEQQQAKAPGVARMLTAPSSSSSPPRDDRSPIGSESDAHQWAAEAVPYMSSTAAAAARDRHDLSARSRDALLVVGSASGSGSGSARPASAGFPPQRASPQPQPQLSIINIGLLAPNRPRSSSRSNQSNQPTMQALSISAAPSSSIDTDRPKSPRDMDAIIKTRRDADRIERITSMQQSNDGRQVRNSFNNMIVTPTASSSSSSTEPTVLLASAGVSTGSHSGLSSTSSNGIVVTLAANSAVTNSHRHRHHHAPTAPSASSSVAVPPVIASSSNNKFDQYHHPHHHMHSLSMTNNDRASIMTASSASISTSASSSSSIGGVGGGLNGWLRGSTSSSSNNPSLAGVAAPTRAFSLPSSSTIPLPSSSPTASSSSTSSSSMQLTSGASKLLRVALVKSVAAPLTTSSSSSAPLASSPSSSSSGSPSQHHRSIRPLSESPPTINVNIAAPSSPLSSPMMITSPPTLMSLLHHAIPNRERLNSMLSNVVPLPSSSSSQSSSLSLPSSSSSSLSVAPSSSTSSSRRIGARSPSASGNINGSGGGSGAIRSTSLSKDAKANVVYAMRSKSQLG